MRVGPATLLFIGLSIAAVPLNIAVAYWAYRRLYRQLRYCRHCRFPMTLLDPVSSDNELSSTERRQQELRSADYDVWACQSCGSVSKCRGGRFFTEYSRCPSCKSKTKSSTTETTEHATEYSHGMVLVTETCQACEFTRSEQCVTPMLDDNSFHDASSR